MANVVHGTVAPGFEPIRDAFAANFERGEIGAALCVHRRGERIVDLWGGVADREAARPWEADTPIVVFSCTKGLVAACFLALQDRGGLDLDAPIRRLWPEFAGRGRDAVTTRMLLNHRSGLCAIDRPLSLADLADTDRTEAALLDQEPLWEPGSDQGYHAISYGLYAQAVFRRAAGRTLGQFLAEELTGPLGADVWLGLPEVIRPRLARLYPTARLQGLGAVLAQLPRDNPEGRMYRDVLLRRRSPSARAVGNPRELGAMGFDNLNRYDVQQLELPWIGGIASARGLAAVYEPLASEGVARDGRRIVSAAAIAAVHPRQSWAARDRVMHKPMGFSQGFLKDEAHLFSPNEATVGHAGMGGSLGLADPDEGLALGYVMNHMAPEMRSRRALALCHAVYRCLGRPMSQAA